MKRRTGGLLALVLGAALSAAGCGDVDLNQGSTGSGKGPEMGMTASTGRARAPSASSMAQSTPSIAVATIAPACGEGLACIANTGCESACDPVDALITSCARCEDGVLADCSQHACQPQP
jgi:hypothetical protein